MDILSYMLGKQNASGGSSANDISNFLDLTPTNAGSTLWKWWETRMVLSNMADLVIEPTAESAGAFENIFNACKWTYIPKIKGTFEVVSLQNAFQNCSNVRVIDLSGLTGTTYRMSSAFNGCSSLEKLDIRGLTFGSGVFSSSMLASVPTTCLIIVKDDDAKTFINTNFSSYTNVKTAAEYEAE